ncbi:MAG: hypothetical protein FJ077_07460 [Cyanobacteria bacterium K_DeepCast_35m_m2_023]|nr:hypothetical protein [Cyanobacteria bacterium K_DeepCast_35m_m2_023]
MAGQHHSTSGGSTLVTAMAGAVLGAAGLAWWLLSEAERRRLNPRQQRALRLSRLQEVADPDDGVETGSSHAAPRDNELHDKVHELNQAIDDVRRQLESLGSR